MSVEEYKVSTRYDELKVKQTELERLEDIDKKASLQAEKGKLTYSTKEVEAIKDQNRSLKVDGYNKDSQIRDLKDKVSRVRNSLLEAQSDLKGVKAPLERLKDLESENKALQAYSEMRPAMQKDMQIFHGQKEKAYQLGDRLVKLKTNYQQIMEEHHKSIEKTNALEGKAQKCDRSVSDLEQRQGGLNASSERLGDLEGQLESTKGIFKIMQRKEIQTDIDQETVNLQKIIDSLKANHSIEAEAIPSRVEHLLDKKTELQVAKQTQIEYTNKCEVAKDVLIREYKYTKALSDTQDKDFRQISARHDASAKLPDHDERHFRTSRDDRAWIVDRMQEKHPQNVERCLGNFAQKDQIDREKMAKQATKNMDMGIER